MSDKTRVIPSYIREGIIKAFVTDIYWDRIYLKIEIQTVYSDDADRSSPLSFCMVDEGGNCGCICSIDSVENDICRISINITNNGYQRAISYGRYSVLIIQHEKQMAELSLPPEMLQRAEKTSRDFLYHNMSRTYTVLFGIGDSPSENSSPLSISICPGEIYKDPERGETKRLLLKPEEAEKKWQRGRRDRLYQKLYEFYRKGRRSKRKRILFFTEQSRETGRNLSAVKDRLIKRGLDREFEIDEYAISVREQPRNSFAQWRAFLKKLAGADIIIMDDHSPTLDWLVLRTSVKVIQLWHAGLGFKASGYARWGHEGCPAPFSCHRQYSYGIAASEKIAHYFSELWGMNSCRVLPTGMPRLDQYLDQEHRENTVRELRERFPQTLGKKLILFAPTYRGRNKKDASYPYHMIDFEGLARVCAEEYIVFFKMHPWVHEKVPVPEKYGSIFFDLSDYPDINELFYITDLLISDYSSNIFEYSLMRRPMLFFAFDQEDYSRGRGLHRPYEESAPGRICRDFDELLEAIGAGDFRQEKLEGFVTESFDHADTASSDRVIDWLIKGDMPDNYKREIERDDAAMEYMRSLHFEK